MHDHHVHPMAMAAAQSSIDCGGGLDALRTAPGTGWIRGVNADQSVDRHRLDAVVGDRPARVQHRSGGLWMLNSQASREVAHVLDHSADVERDADGDPTGRLWRYDERLRAGLPATGVDLSTVVDDVRRFGITSVTDATLDLDADTVARLSSLPMPVTLLGDLHGRGPVKLLLRDHDLPVYDGLVERIRRIHAAGRPVAVHCVTRESLLLTLAALDDLGRHPGDRIEHASITPDPELLRGMTVVTQPAFVTTRGDDHERDVDPHDRPHLYRYASLLRAEARVFASSDAPFGPLDPWEVIRAARDRELGRSERVSAHTALASYLTNAYGRPRRIEAGTRTDLVLLHVPLATALDDVSAQNVDRVFTAR